MAADASIYNALLQPPKSALDYASAYAAQDDARNQRYMNALQMQQAKQSMQDDQALRNYLSGGADLNSAEGQAGLWRAAPTRAGAIIKQQTENKAATVKSDAEAFKLASDRYSAYRKTAGALFNDPAITKDRVIGAISGLQSAGLMDPQMAANLAQSLPDDPQQLRATLRQAAAAELTPEQMFSVFAPKPEKIDNGGSVFFRDTNPNSPTYGQNTAGGVTAKVLTPGEAATLAETRRHNRATEGQAATAVTYQQDASGNFVALPTRLQPGQTAAGVPVIGPDGKPIGKGSTLNDSQAKAYLFGTRMQEADKILADMAGKGVDMPSITKTAAESVPLIGGGLGAFFNTFAASDDQQSVEQAQRDFVNAVLRRESGAAISSSEFDNAKKQYFPQIGDSAQVKAQKARNRQLAIKGMMSEVPANAGGRPAGGAGGGVVDFGSLK